MATKHEPGSDAWCSEHGIDPDVWRARGCVRYDVGDGWVKDEFRPWFPDDPRKRSNGKLNSIQAVVNQAPGIFMPKQSPPGYAPIPPQLRPDVPVYTDRRSTWHYHGDHPNWPRLPDGTWPRTDKGAPLHRPGGSQKLKRLILHPELVEDHINGRVEKGGHGGVNPQGVHEHEPKTAKYVFASIEGDRLKRIEMSPLAQERWASAGRVFFVMEGVLKDSAVLSAGEVSVNIASVTQWGKRELRRFAREYLQGKSVFVVPDADWASNWLVYSQALFIREELRAVLGDEVASVAIAAPPVEFFRAMEERGVDGLKGVDDWLGTFGTEWAAEVGWDPGIQGLDVSGREYAPEIVAAPGEYWKKVEVRNLSLHAGLREIRLPDGTTQKVEAPGELRRSAKGIARILNVRVEHVPDHLREIEESLEIDGDIAVERKTIEYQDENGVTQEYVFWGWVGEQPVIHVRPEYHAIESEEPVLLKESA